MIPEIPTAEPIQPFQTDVMTDDTFSPDAYISVINSHISVPQTPHGPSFKGYSEIYRPQLVGKNGEMFSEHELVEIMAVEEATGINPNLSGRQLGLIQDFAGLLSRSSAIVETAGDGFTRVGLLPDERRSAIFAYLVEQVQKQD